MSHSRTQFYGASSLDGFLATPDDDLDWLLQWGNPPSSYAKFIAGVGALAMGAATYEWLMRHHVRPGTADAQPWPYSQRTWVFTHRRLIAPAGADVHFVHGEVEPVHREMRVHAGEKTIWLVGGGELVGQFWDRGLLDDIIVQIVSVMLGAGKPLLPRRIQTPALKLVSVERFGDAFVELRYEVPKPERSR